MDRMASGDIHINSFILMSYVYACEGTYLLFRTPPHTTIYMQFYPDLATEAVAVSFRCTTLTHMCLALHSGIMDTKYIIRIIVYETTNLSSR